MSDRETIEHWAGEFADSFAFSTLPDATKAHATQICIDFLAGAAEAAGAPDEIDGKHLPAGFDRVVALDLPMEEREAIPETVAVFLEWLQTSGRLAGGAELASWARATTPTFKRRLSPQGGEKGVPIRTAPKVGRNEPCPCGSGRKYKRCCGGGT